MDTMDTQKQLEILTGMAKRLLKTLESKPEPNFATIHAAVTDFIMGAVDPVGVLSDRNLLKIVVQAGRRCNPNKHNADFKKMLDYELGLPE